MRPARQKHPATIALGARIKSRREELGLSQRAVAERAGLDWSYTARTERGERNITFLNLLRLSDGLSIDAGELIRGLASDDSP
jgi:transcriptional regulator with XRE-family HTH domain